MATTLEISNVTVEKIPLTINPQAETSWYYNSDEHSLQMNAVPTTESNAITYEWYDGDTKLECDSDVYTIPKTMPAGNYGYTCKVTCDGYTLSKYFSFEIKQAVTALDDIKSYNGDTETDKFFVDDTITVKATLDVAGESPVSSMRNSARVEAPASGQMALFIDDIQVSETADAGTDGSYTMEVSAFDVLSQRGTEPNSTAITLTAKYIGDSNLSDAEGTVEVNISAYATVTWSKASETAYYTGNAISSDNISGLLKVTGASDTDITAYYDTADYTFSYRTYQFGIGGSNAGGLGLPSTASFEDGLPTEIGTYQIKATVKEKENYQGAETTEYLTLTVDWFDCASGADLHDQNMNDVSSGTEYWAQSITFTAPSGFTISQELNGTYVTSFTYQE